MSDELVLGARRELDAAVHALVGIRHDMIERDGGSRRVVLPSLYDELCEARMGEQSSGGARRPLPGSRAPGWADALSLVVEIDQRAAAWHPVAPAEPADRPVTARRLWALADRTWTPEEIGAVRRKTAAVRRWVNLANTLLPAPDEAAHQWDLRAPCPACGETSILVDSGAGEQVRRYVLRADRSAAQCVSCGTSWAPEQYRLLARMIGADLPDGVLE